MKFNLYNHLGFFGPLYFRDSEGKIVLGNDFKDVLSRYPKKRILDITAVIEILNKRFILGDRTLIRGINRSPWMAKPDVNNKEWLFSNLPSHFEKEQDESIVANTLFNLICQEILSYIGNKKSVGILLSGGMDSRIVAGALDFLIKTGHFSNLSVNALTWGNPLSRDTIYAKKIADRLQWNWTNYKVGSDELLINIYETAVRGCEYSPIHLHALPQIRNDNNLDCVLAGSYGDSIGRGEYEGIKVQKLAGLNNNYKNFSYFLKYDVYKLFKNSWMNDIVVYHEKFPQQKLYQQVEQDYQLHYMRRMLNPCMEVINDKMPIYQVFTDPSVFGYMWSLHPRLRNDIVYKLILSLFKTDLSDIPWARTGLPYGSNNGEPDQFTQSHHVYGKLISNKLLPRLYDMIISDDINSLGVFNMDSLVSVLNLIKRFPTHNFDYLERLIWIASLSEMQKIYKFEVEDIFKYRLKDRINSNFYVHTEYTLKYLYRKLNK